MPGIPLLATGTAPSVGGWLLIVILVVVVFSALFYMDRYVYSRPEWVEWNRRSGWIAGVAIAAIFLVAGVWPERRDGHSAPASRCLNLPRHVRRKDGTRMPSNRPLLGTRGSEDLVVLSAA
jgi:hypothetical protein